MSDLSETIGLCRGHLTTYTAGLALLADDDLHQTVRSPSLQPRVSGTATPASLWDGDRGLVGQVYSAARTVQWVALGLSDPALSELVTDPQPADEAPCHDRTHLPTLAELTARAKAVDRSLRELHDHIHSMPFAAKVQTAQALTPITDEMDYPRRSPARTVTHPRWGEMGVRARMECVRCGELAGRALLCQKCTAGNTDRWAECGNPQDRDECRRMVTNRKQGLCASCDQARRDARRCVA